MQTVQIISTSKRAKERALRHGATMKLMRIGTFRGVPAILVESLEKSYSVKGIKMPWTGWFTKDEIDWDKTLDSISQ